jgi:WD40 repeat protein
MSWDSHGIELAAGSYGTSNLMLFSSAGKVRRLPYSFDERINATAWKPGNRELAITTFDSVLIWDMTTNRITSRRPLPFQCFALIWSKDGTSLSLAGNNSVIIWQPKSGRARTIPISPIRNAFFRVGAWSPDGEFLAAIGNVPPIVRSEGRTLILLNVKALERHELQTDGSHWITSVAWSRTGKSLAAATSSSVVNPASHIVLWNIADGRRRMLASQSDSERSVAWASDDTLVVTGNSNNIEEISFLNADTGEVTASIDRTDLAFKIDRLAVSPTGQTVAFGSDRGDLIFWDILARKPYVLFRGAVPER